MQLQTIKIILMIKIFLNEEINSTKIPIMPKIKIKIKKIFEILEIQKEQEMLLFLMH